MNPSSDGEGEEWVRWLELARQTVESTIQELPAHLRQHVVKLPVIYELMPSEDIIADGIEPDTLGLFVGQPYPDAISSSDVMPAQIILYVENLRALAEDDEDIYREEVQTTFLHELGHFLGLDEDDLADRDLD